jgi:hypothetical protein
MSFRKANHFAEATSGRIFLKQVNNFRCNTIAAIDDICSQPKYLKADGNEVIHLIN